MKLVKILRITIYDSQLGAMKTVILKKSLFRIKVLYKYSLFELYIHNRLPNGDYVTESKKKWLFFMHYNYKRDGAYNQPSVLPGLYSRG